MRKLIEQMRAKWLQEQYKHHLGTLDRALFLGKVQAADELLKLLNPCVWTHKVHLGEDHNDWDTGCFERYTILEGTPTENKMKYCPYCGNEIEEDKP